MPASAMGREKERDPGFDPINPVADRATAPSKTAIGTAGA